MPDTFVLEVVEFLTENTGENGLLVSGGNFRHVEYMKAKFKTRDDSVSYDEVYTKYRYRVSNTPPLFFHHLI